MVERIDGCHHIICNCDYEFCYLCGERWKTCDCEDDEYDYDEYGFYERRIAPVAVNPLPRVLARHRAPRRGPLPSAPRPTPHPDILETIPHTVPPQISSSAAEAPSSDTFEQSQKQEDCGHAVWARIGGHHHYDNCGHTSPGFAGICTECSIILCENCR